MGLTSEEFSPTHDFFDYRRKRLRPAWPWRPPCPRAVFPTLPPTSSFIGMPDWQTAQFEL